MLLNNAIGIREAQPRPLDYSLGGVKGLKNAIQDIRADAAPRVGHLKPNSIRIASDSNSDLASRGIEGMGCIDQQVQSSLTLLRGNALHLRQLTVPCFHVSLVLQLVVDSVQCGLNTLIQIRILPFKLLILTGEILQILNDLADPCNAIP